MSYKLKTKKNAIGEHIPGFVEGYEPRITEFDTIEELLGIDWVAKWFQGLGGDEFIGLRLKDKTLLARYKDQNDKERSRVIGNLFHHIPDFDSELAKIPNAFPEVRTKEAPKWEVVWEFKGSKDE